MFDEPRNNHPDVIERQLADEAGEQ